MAQPVKQFYTPAEYLALEDAAEYKHEYYNGEVFMMAGASNNHTRIVRNFTRDLDLAFTDRQCEAFPTDMKVASEQRNFFSYPDIVVVCGEILYEAGRTDTITNPTAIIEVLSPSTRKYDRGDKFTLYKQGFKTLQLYVLVDQKKVSVEVFQRQPDGNWTVRSYEKLEDILQLSVLAFETPVANLYRKVEFKQRLRHPEIKGQEPNQDGPAS